MGTMMRVHMNRTDVGALFVVVPEPTTEAHALFSTTAKLEQTFYLHFIMVRVNYPTSDKEFFGTRQQKRQEAEAIRIRKKMPNPKGCRGGKGNPVSLRGAGAPCRGAFNGPKP